MGRIPDEIIRQVRDHGDVVELIGRSVALKRAGRNYKGLCPFHDEKTPSFNVNPDRQSYYCFGCQEGGDIFAFLMKVENLTFIEAVRSLARDCGIEIPESQGGERGGAEKLYDANATVHSAYQAELAKACCPGTAYFTERGLDDEIVGHFGLGYAPDVWEFAVGVLREARIPAETGARAGLLSERKSGGHYDLLRGRAIFPIQDARGRVIGFGGRAMAEGQEPKYLNTPESPVFRKREALYGFPHALESMRRADEAIVVEGYFDRIALHRAGVENGVATCGTSLTADHARALRRRVGGVVLLFDGDEAGQRAVERSLEVLLPAGLRVRAALLPPGDDPDTYLLREGGDALRTLVERAPAALEVVIDRAVADGVAEPWAKADAVARVSPHLARLGSAVERASWCERLALAVGTEARHVEAAVRAAARGEDAREAVPLAPQRSGPEERNLHQLARSLVEHPALGRKVAPDELGALLPTGPIRELITALVEAATEDRAVEIEELAAALSGPASSLLRAFAAGDVLPDEDVAAQTIDDTLRWLRKKQLKRDKQQLTQRLRDPNEDAESILREKQQLISRKDPGSHTPMGTPLA